MAPTIVPLGTEAYNNVLMDCAQRQYGSGIMCHYLTHFSRFLLMVALKTGSWERCNLCALTMAGVGFPVPLCKNIVILNG